MVSPSHMKVFKMKKAVGDVYWTLRSRDIAVLVLVLFGVLAALTASAAAFPDNSLDMAVNEFFEGIHGTFLDEVMYGITILGSIGGVLLLMAAVVFILGRNNAWLDAAVSVVAVGGAQLVKEVMKSAIRRARPENAIIHAEGFSFPSGHATAAAAVAVVLVFVLGKHLKGRTKKTVEWFAVAYGVMVGFSRIFLNVHWLSDVMAGFALGAGWSFLMMLVSSPVYKKQKEALEG
ncbi:phosphatase PAP2 family protein [Candidatus Woesearchaeota archaeon]|nr:MAG: phosphatase PAP2 family protein [Candidatus Woesearchaeota archaeon]